MAACKHCGHDEVVIPQPLPLERPDLGRLRVFLDEYLSKSTCNHHDCDCDHYMCELILTTFYGDEVWPYISAWDE